MDFRNFELNPKYKVWEQTSKSVHICIYMYTNIKYFFPQFFNIFCF